MFHAFSTVFDNTCQQQGRKKKTKKYNWESFSQKVQGDWRKCQSIKFQVAQKKNKQSSKAIRYLLLKK